MILAIHLTPRAVRDLEEQSLWYELQRPGLGEDFVASVDATLDRIRANPSLYPRIRSTIRRAMTDRFPFGLFYVVQSERIVVLSIVHGRRDPHVWPAPRRDR